MFNPGSNYLNMPFIVEGEIMEVHDYPSDSTKKIKQVRYVCKVEMQNGSQILVPNCIESTMFGGIADYMQIRHKSSSDNLEAGASSGLTSLIGKKTSGYQLSDSDDKNNARVGDRVYIAFINGNITRPVIIGSAQHPNQIDEFGGEKHSEVKPQAIFQYNGMRFTVDKDGQFTLMHKGLPKIKNSPGAGAKSSAGGGLAGKLSTTATEPKSDAVTFPSQKEERTLLEFLKEGIFRIRDSEGQIIEIDRKKKRIHLSNNELKSTDVAGGALAAVSGLGDKGSKADFITIDGDDKKIVVSARKEVQINSKDERNDKTGGDYTHEISGDSEETIDGDVTITVSGDVEEEISGDFSLDISGDSEEKIGGDWEVTSSGAVTLKGSGATLKLSEGKVGLGGSSAELLDLLDKLLKQMDDTYTQIQAITVLGNLGYPSGTPINTPAFIAIQTQVATIKQLLSTIKGGI